MSSCPSYRYNPKTGQGIEISPSASHVNQPGRAQVVPVHSAVSAAAQTSAPGHVTFRHEVDKAAQKRNADFKQRFGFDLP
jgi:hypothetical protein